MQLTSVNLENVGPHRKLQVEFRNGLIGLLGPQGSGKSTLIAAMYAGLTNDFSRFYGGKTGAIRQRVKDTEHVSQVELQLRHAQQDYAVQRLLQPVDKHRLRRPGQKDLTKAGEIDVILSAITGGRSLLDNYVFVRQAGLVELFNYTVTQRAAALAKLCGTLQAEAGWKLLGGQIEQDAKLAGDVLDTSDEIRKQLGDLQARLKGFEQQQTELQQQCLDEATRAQYVGDVSVFEQRQTLQQDLVAAEAAEKQLLVAARAATKAVAEAMSLRDQQQQYAETCRQEHERLRQADAQRQQLQTAWDLHLQDVQALEAAERALAGLIEPVAPTESATVEALTGEISRVQRALSPHETLIESFETLEGQQHCPVCQQELHNPLQQLEAAKSFVATHQPLLLQLQSRRKQLTDYSMAIAEWEKDRERSLQRVEELSRRLAGDPPTKPQPSDKATLAAAAQQRDAATRQHNTLVKACDTAVAAKATAIAKHKAGKQRLLSLQEQWQQTVQTSAEQYAEAQQRLAAHSEATKSLQELAGRLAECRQSVQAKEQELTQFLARAKRSLQAQRWLQVADRGRSILHREMLPHRVHERALRRMENGINAMLELFESPFRVKTSPEDLSYTAYFSNGTVMPAQGLSGGQQTILALALRWTLNSVFAEHVGMMVLDEPTAWLDRRHRELLRVALRGLSLAAQDHGCQVIIITHEQSLEGSFDQVVKLGKATV